MAQDLPALPTESESSVLVPPRPNLGPEPLTEPAFGWPSVVYIASAVVLAAVVGWKYARRRASRRHSETRPEEFAGNGDAAETSPGVRLLALAERARAVLITRFGEPWRAKTTEEILSDPRFSSTFVAEEAAMFLALLRRADVEKFSQHGEPGDQGDLMLLLDNWESLLRDRFESGAGARSTINGK